MEPEGSLPFPEGIKNKRTLKRLTAKKLKFRYKIFVSK
jgi:hypothetical protein